MTLKFCPKCGSELESNTSFCASCGADLRSKRVEYEATAKTVIQPVVKITHGNIEYATLISRLLALIIDGIIIAIIGSLLSLAIFVPWIPFNIFNPFEGGFWALSFPFDWVIGFFYFWILEAYNDGQTVGKKALNIRTVDEKTLGTSTSSKYAMNNILKPSGFIILDLIIGIIKNSGDSKGRLRIMQYVSETVVISTK